MDNNMEPSAKNMQETESEVLSENKEREDLAALSKHFSGPPPVMQWSTVQPPVAPDETKTLNTFEISRHTEPVSLFRSTSMVRLSPSFSQPLANN